MPILIATLGAGKGTWGHITRVMNDKEWSKVIIVTNDFGKDNFKPEKPVDYIMVDSIKTSITKMVDVLVPALKEKVNDETEVSLNIISGTGKEHISIIAALMKAGLSFRLIALTGTGITEF